MTETAKNLISSSELLVSFGDSDAESYEPAKEKAWLSEVGRHPRTQNSELDSFPPGERSVAKIFEATYLFITINYYHLTIGSISVPHQKENLKGINFIKVAVLIIYIFCVSQNKKPILTMLAQKGKQFTNNASGNLNKKQQENKYKLIELDDFDV